MIELLVVISIVSVVAGMLMPVLAIAKDAARRQLCANKLRQFGLANFVYAGNNDGQCVAGIQWNLLGASTSVWFTNVAFKEAMDADGYAGNIWPKRYWCPLVTETAPHISYVYGMHFQIPGMPYPNPGYDMHVNLAAQSNPGGAMMFADALDWSLCRDPLALYTTEFQVNKTHVVASRHNMKAGCVYYDGHVEYVSREVIVLNGLMAVRPPFWTLK